LLLNIKTDCSIFVKLRTRHPFPTHFALQDRDYAGSCQVMYQNSLLQSKFIEPLTAKKNEYDKKRKQLRETWTKEKRRSVSVTWSNDWFRFKCIRSFKSHDNYLLETVFLVKTFQVRFKVNGDVW